MMLLVKGTHPRQILDVAISSVLWTSGDCPGAFVANLLLQGGIGTSGVDVQGLGSTWGRGKLASRQPNLPKTQQDRKQKYSRQGNITVRQLVIGNQLGLSRIPSIKNLSRGGTAKDSGVDEAGELDVRDMSTGAKDALEIPDRLGAGVFQVRGRSITQGEGTHTQMDKAHRGSHPVINTTTSQPLVSREIMIILKRTYPIALVKNTRKSPRLILKRLNIHDLDKQQITRFGTLDLERPREVVDLCQVDISDIVCVVCILDLSAGPVYAQSAS